MSFGNVAQEFNLDTEQLTLVLGENLDNPGNAGNSRNGVGKSGCLNAICFALYGQSVANIRKDNLINLTNEKNLEVSLEFEAKGINYRIERGRKPNYFKFFVNDVQQGNLNESLDVSSERDESQGESRETQAEVDRVIGFSSEIFKQLIGLNTLSIPFLSLPAKDQRSIIEELLGITQLSEKAEKLKELLRDTKASIAKEEIKIQTAKESNEKIQKSINDLRNRSKNWALDHESQISLLQQKLETLLELDIDSEIDNHKIYDSGMLAARQLSKLESDCRSKKRNLADLQSRLKQYENNISTVCEDASCPTCGQKVHEHQQEEILESIIVKKDQISTQILSLENEISKINSEILTTKQAVDALGDIKKPFYNTIDEAYNHRSKLDGLAIQLEKMIEDTNPYDDHVISQQENLLQNIDIETIKQLNLLCEHQEFLLKLLTNKDSAVRKLIIDQNLNYLNFRLSEYADKLGLPHSVKFINDLSVSITEHGRELDFDNLSTGERRRLILSLSFAFRDVFESLNMPINLLFLDEAVDSGIDSSGLEAILAVLKEKIRESKRSIFLVSHREELIPRVSNILMVVKENGFSTIQNGLNE